MRGPDFAPCTFSLEFLGGAEPFERTVPKGTEVQFVLQPPTPRERWVGFLTVRITDAVGAEVVRDMVQIDGKQDFVWRIGLLTGTYSVTASALGDGKVSTTFTVPSEPLRLELQLAK